MRTFRFVVLFIMVTGSAATAMVGLGCSKLTSPPAPEPIASDTLALASASAPHPPASVQQHPMPTQLPAGTASAAPQPAGDLKIEDVTPGKGPQVKMGDTISVHYLGTLQDGTKFDASRDHGQPFTFSLPGRVIDGWNKGIPGMRVGGKRKLTIPPQMGYGPRGSPPKIPPNATLVFEIELLEIKSPGPAASGAPH